MRMVRALLSAALVTSSAFGTQILATDRFLWVTAPTHAYGLIAFVTIDIVLVAAIWMGTRLATFAAMLVAAIQSVAMLGDILGGQPTGLGSNVFMNYLLADTSFISLLVTQGIILVLAIGTLAMPLVHGHKVTLLRVRKQ